MSELQIFQSEQFGEIRTVNRGGQPWFVAADVCRALDVVNSRDAVARLDEDEKNTVVLTDGTPGNPNLSIVNEPGLYALVLGSRKPEARQFKRWITHDVIPSIRQTGAYLTPDKLEEVLYNPDTIISLAQQLKQLQEQARRDKPKVLFASAVEASQTSILIGELAKLMRQNGVSVGQNRLYERLRNDGYLMKHGASRNMPTQRSMEMGLFEIKESTMCNPDGSIRVTRTTKVTGRGQTYFINLYLDEQTA